MCLIKLPLYRQAIHLDPRKYILRGISFVTLIHIITCIYIINQIHIVTLTIHLVADVLLAKG